MATDLLGRWGESLAAKHLREKGFLLLGANYRCRFGEIDLIAQKDSYLVFVEVKLRKSNAFAEAMEFVHLKKQSRIRSTAQLYIAQHGLEELQPRFDVVEVYAPQGLKTKMPEIHHLEDAFA